MERRFDMSDFEQSLKDHADQFTLTPSKRVWNGIYNNLHPGSTWPSITVGIIFLITLFTIGTLNHSPAPLKSKQTASSAGPINPVKTGKGLLKNNLTAPLEEGIISTQIPGARPFIHPADKSIHTPGHHTQPASINQDRSVKADQASLTHKKGSVNATTVLPHGNPEQKAGETAEPGITTGETIPSGIAAGKENVPELPAIAGPELFVPFINDRGSLIANQKISFPEPVSFYPGRKNIEAIHSATWSIRQNENGNSIKPKRKKKQNAEWTFYLTPMVSAVFFHTKTIQPARPTGASAVAAIVVLPNQPPFELIHNPRFGFETGAEMSIKISKRFQFITGANLSYSGYTNISNLVHPTFATLLLVNENGSTYSKNYITHYGNGQSQNHISLTNYSLETSVPVGLQYNLWKNEHLRIDIASLFEPSVVLKSDAYIISSDGRYYVNDPSLIRTMNIGGNFGSYITFIGKNMKWHLGPTVRYQLLSTYKNNYPTKEHLVDYGIRIGISK